MRFFGMILSLAALSLAPVAATAAVIVDTGQPASRSGGSLLRADQWLSGQFDVAAPDIIHTVEAFFLVGLPGDLTLTLRSNLPNELPGTVLFSRAVSFTETQSLARWQGALDLDWAVGPGTYWLGLEVPTTAFAGVVPGSPPYPLGPEAVFQEGAWRRADSVQMGLRINASVTGNPGGIPEPATWALMICGFGLAGVGLRRRRSSVA